MDARKKAIFAFQLVKPILQTITHVIQLTVLGITVRYTKISSISIPSHPAFSSSNASGRRLQWLDSGLYENKPIQNAFKRI